MEHRDQRQESHGVHFCNKCGWSFPNPHPSAKHRRAHKRVCGTIEGFKLVESEANTIFTTSDDDGDQKSSSPTVLRGSCDDKGVDGMKKKSKESEDEVFSDAVAEFSEGVGPDKFAGDALDSVSSSKMVAEDRSQTLKDRDVLVENSIIAETTINQSGSEQKNKSYQEFVNLETDSGTTLSSFATENKKVENLVVAEAINRSGNEQETKVDQELVNLDTDFETPSSSSSTENRKVEISVVSEATINQSGTEQETKINRECVNLETNIRTGDSVVPPNDHMNTTIASDLYPIEPETIIPAPQQERNINSVENVPQCSLPSPDRRCDEKKNEDFGSCKNLAEIAASSGKMDDDKSEPEPKMEETIEIPTEPFAHNLTLQSVAVNDMSVHSETSPSVVVSDVKPIDLTQVTSDARKELESFSSNYLQETDKIKEGNDNVHLPSVSSELNVVDGPEALVEDSKDHNEVKLTNCVEGVSGLEDNFKDPIPEESYSSLQAEPFDQVSEVASFDTKTVESRQKPESGGNNVLVDVKADCFRNCGQETEEIPIQQDSAAQIEGIHGENEKYQKGKTLCDAVKFGIDSIPSASFSPEVEPVAPSKNSLDSLSENVTEILFDEKSMAAPTGNVVENVVGIGGVLLADDESKAGAFGRTSEDTVHVRLPVDARERKDDGVGEKDEFYNLDIAGVEDKKNPSEELFSIGIDSTPESTTNNSRENKCIAVAEAIADESLGKFSGTESIDSRKFDIILASGTQQSAKEDDRSSSVHVACISEVVNSDNESCHVRDFNSVQNSSDVHANKEANLVSVSNESVTGRSVSNESVTGRSDAFQDGSVSQLVGDADRIASETWKDDGVKTDVKPQLTPSLLDVSVDAVRIASETWKDDGVKTDIKPQLTPSLLDVSVDAVGIASETWKDDGVKIDVKPQLTPSLLDASVDAISRTDSLEGNWGSISVLSTLSDLPPVVNGEVTLQARAEAEENDLKKADAATERQHSDRSDLFEPPSFMTLVEPTAGGIQNSAASEIQTARNQQQPNAAPLQAGWFPSYTHVANDSPGRKKNEAIIAKVTNWSTGKPHTALKNLLDDAALESKQKSSPTRKENLASMIQKDEKSMKNGSIDKTIDSAMQPKSPTSQLGNREFANEWNSPARYPSDIRRERRKGKPYWAQFVCCSSVH